MTRLSDIDSKRFGVTVARIDNVTAQDIAAAEEFCAANNVKLLMARCDTGDTPAAQAMEKRGFLLMDTLMYFKIDFSKKGPPPLRESDLPIRPVKQGEEEAVKQLSHDAFSGYKGGHYHSDPRLDPVKCAEAYGDWAYNSALKKAADEVLIAEADGVPGGFMTLKKDGEIPLAVVRPDLQKRGIYSALLSHAAHWQKNNNSPSAFTGTQVNNTAVQKAFVRSGFEPDRSVYTFHKWYD